MEKTEDKDTFLPKPESIVINISTPVKKEKEGNEYPKGKEVLTPLFIFTGILLFLVQILSDNFLTVCWSEYCFFAGIYFLSLWENKRK